MGVVEIDSDDCEAFIWEFWVSVILEYSLTSDKFWCSFVGPVPRCLCWTVGAWLVELIHVLLCLVSKVSFGAVVAARAAARS